MPDVGVGTYTSGGIDSAVINILGLQRPRTREYSDIFGDVFEDKLFDESEHQRLVARSLGLTSNEVASVATKDTAEEFNVRSFANCFPPPGRCTPRLLLSRRRKP